MSKVNEYSEMLSKSFCYLGGEDLLNEFKQSDNEGKKNFEKTRDKIRLLLKKYLELDNVGFLFGTGSSIMLGAKSIRDIPEQIEEAIKKNKRRYNRFIKLIRKYQNKTVTEMFIKEKSDKYWKIEEDSEKVYRYIKKDIQEDSCTGKSKNTWGNIVTPLENFTDYLLGLLYISEFSNKVYIDGDFIKKEDIENLILVIKEALFNLCNFETNPNKLHYHRKFVKSLLGRPINLRRANIFTTNYDLIFEQVFDDLGINYVNGFVGFNNRSFKPEVFDYDMYYPGNTTEGKVRRVEKVIRYYKLHGSLNWVAEKQSGDNIYGLKEYPIDLIENECKKHPRNRKIKIGDLIIYPTSYKKGFTLDFPYSELFRHFAASIIQQQSVLFCVGYSFFDEHINDIIYQALSIPSFTLIIIDLFGNSEIEKLNKLKDPRIIILTGDLLGDFKYFADQIMPNFHEINTNEKISKTLNTLYSERNHESLHEVKDE